MMARTQITLEPELHRRVRQRAGEMGVSLAEYIRRVVARDLGNPASTANPSAIFDLGESGKSDIAKDKRLMLGQAFAKRHSK
ncbi:MAG: ribbon-helix-helix domain-containing protein [Bryobacteraceae bacterium]|nr:ribbon-helix-helix domain-containing protein [Bryobacteraceae bacterium]